jgi:hypothetical protein
VVEHLGDPGAVLVIDETGDLKKGTYTVGTQRADLEARQLGYVLAVARDHRVGFGGVSHRVDALLARVPARAWQCVSAGGGAKGQRHYDWAFVRLDHHSPPPAGQAGRHWLLVRRNHRSGELAFFRCYTPAGAPGSAGATLAMLAYAFLVVAALTQHTRHPPAHELIGVTCSEVQHLFAALLARPTADRGHRLRWSVWRRRHQQRPHLPLPTKPARDP